MTKLDPVGEYRQKTGSIIATVGGFAIPIARVEVTASASPMYLSAHE